MEKSYIEDGAPQINGKDDDVQMVLGQLFIQEGKRKLGSLLQSTQNSTPYPNQRSKTVKL